MRVTKLIREYVEESVRQKFKPEKNKVWEDYNAKVDSVYEAIQEIVNEANEKAIAIAREAGVCPEPGRYDNKITLVYMSRSVGNREIEAELREKDREIRDRERDTVANVLLGLELGQTDKTELESVLAAIEV